MKRQILTMIAIGSLTLVAAHPLRADESTEELKKQIEELKAKVADLENRQAIPQQNRLPTALGNSWDPFADMQAMHDQMQRMFDQALSQTPGPGQGMFSNQLFFDQSQIQETKDAYVITMDVADFDKNKIDIKADDHSISISGEYGADQKSQDPNKAFESHSYGRFLNTIPIPKDADATKMTTEKKGSQLVIRLPKKTV